MKHLSNFLSKLNNDLNSSGERILNKFFNKKNFYKKNMKIFFRKILF